MTTIVQTTSGPVSGIQRDTHAAYFGIPFATAERFRDPQSPASWSAVRECTQPGFASPQTTHPIPGFAASGPQGEDCLNLNVFTPAPDGQQRPVLFWIHGGGFTHGTGSEPLYDGGPLATRGDVVVVTINYRLGALGYLYLGKHLPAHGLTANAGQLDQIAALEWVRDNIAAFGGDPANVTIFGESAGAAAVATLLAMPAARGLFHRAIMQSGAGRAAEPDAAARVTDSLLEELGLPTSDAERLLELPAQDIVAAQAAVSAKVQRQGWGLGFGPVRDGDTLPDHQLRAIRAGSASNIPVLIGTNRDEVKLFAATMAREELDEDRLIRAVAATIPGATVQSAADLVALYRRSRTAKSLPTSSLDILDAIQSDVRFRLGAMRLALAQREHQPNTYAYLVTYASPARHGALGSCHALEMPFVFGTLRAPTQDRFAGSGPAVEHLSTNMMDAWLAFARSSSPAHEGIGPWPAYDAAARATMVFDLKSGAQADPFGEERAALEQLLGAS